VNLQTDYRSHILAQHTVHENILEYVITGQYFLFVRRGFSPLFSRSLRAWVLYVKRRLQTVNGLSRRWDGYRRYEYVGLYVLLLFPQAEVHCVIDTSGYSSFDSESCWR